MTSENLIRMAESCSVVRRSIGRVLLSPEESAQRQEAEAAYRAGVRELLRVIREEECALVLEAAGELAR